MGFSRQSLRLVAGALSRSLEPLSMRLHESSRRGTIFLLHRVSARPDPAYPPLQPAEFDRHCRFFRDHFEVVAFAELVARWREGKSVARLAAITFDDGYRDFLLEAYPILERHALPCTHFLVEDCVRSGLPTWNLRLRHVVPSHREREPRLRELAGLTAAARYRWLEERESASPPAYPAMLTAEDLSRVDGKLVSWQSHTASHPLLDQCPGEELERELAGSRRAIEAWTGQPVRFLSYPNGASNAAARDAARAAGYECAVAVGQERLPRGGDLFAMPRLDVGGLPRAMLASEVAGVHSALRGIF